MNDVLNRILVLVPTNKDAQITSSLLLRAGMHCLVCEDMPHLAREIKLGAGAVLLTEEVLGLKGIRDLVDAMKQQPAWSDLPVVMLLAGGTASAASGEAVAALRNVTLIDRPAPIRTVLSAVQAALRSRQRQYQIRDQLETISAAQQERQFLLDSERAARLEAERANRTKDEFLATLSHELRTPLTAIVGWTQIMKKNPMDTSAISDGLKVLDRAARTQLRLIEDLLEMSRIISGKIRLERQAVKVREVVDAAMKSVMPAAGAKEIRLERNIDPSATFVNADAARLQQVLWNLLTNAIKFTPKGGSVFVSAQASGSHLEIRVRDTGQGIASDFLPHLFERFTQANSSTTRQHGGLGLGLSIVRSLVELHEGTIGVESAGTGHGSTFIVKLPIGGENTGSGKSVSPTSDAQRLKGVKVLVVDDDADSREVVRRFLLQAEGTPLLAASAAEAQSLLNSFTPDVIVSDIGMPNQDGYEFMRALRVHGVKIPAIALTAFARPEDRIRSMEAGYQMHLTKPVEPTEFITVVASLAGRYNSAA